LLPASYFLLLRPAFALQTVPEEPERQKVLVIVEETEPAYVLRSALEAVMGSFELTE
jgi:hypothetical protein